MCCGIWEEGMVYSDGKNLRKFQQEIHKNISGESVVILQIMEEQFGRKKKEYVQVLEE